MQYDALKIQKDLKFFLIRLKLLLTCYTFDTVSHCKTYEL